MRIIRMIVVMLGALLCWGLYPCNGAVEPDVHRRPDLLAELPTILFAAERNRCRGEDLLILLAIRLAENGGPGREFGVMHPRAIDTDLDTQAGWAAATVVKNRKRWRLCAGCRTDFITFLGNRYCPKESDAEGNRNWKKNVRFWFNKFKGNVNAGS